MRHPSIGKVQIVQYGSVISAPLLIPRPGVLRAGVDLGTVLLSRLLPCTVTSPEKKLATSLSKKTGRGGSGIHLAGASLSKKTERAAVASQRGRSDPRNCEKSL